MNSLGKTQILLFLVIVIFTSCNSLPSTPTLGPENVMNTAISTASTALAGTQRAIPTATPFSLPTISLTTVPLLPTPLSTATPLVFTDPSIPLSKRIVYYYFVTPAEDPIPKETILAVHLLAPTYADEAYTADTVADLGTALEFVLHDGRNIWLSTKLEIPDITFRNGHASVVLQGEYFGVGGGVLEAASRQILLTVFANPSVQNATISLNGGTIWNLGVSNSMHAKPDDYVYTRAEIEAYMKEHAYVSP